MFKRLARWILRNEIWNDQMEWWKAGVNQQLHDSVSAEHGHISHSKYWYGIEGCEEE